MTRTRSVRFGVAALLFVATLAPRLGAASEEAYVSWTELSFVAAAPSPFGATTVTLETDAGKLSSLAIECAEAGAIEIPDGALTAIDSPQLHAIRTTWEVGYDPEPWFYVKVPYGEPVTLDDAVRYRTVVFAVQGKRVVYRALTEPKAGGGNTWTQEKL